MPHLVTENMMKLSHKCLIKIINLFLIKIALYIIGDFVSIKSWDSSDIYS